MAKTRTVLQVFVASPGDVVDERTLLTDIVAEFNNTWGNHNGVVLELLKWEINSRPGFGDDAQDVINKSIGDEYDIFIGIMWGRFGSPTHRAESGTEEEFNRAYARLDNRANSVQIMFYFKDAGISPSRIDAAQLQKVQDFKKDISAKYNGLYHSFETAEQFQSSVRMHLSTIVQNWLDANSSVPLRVKKTVTSETKLADEVTTPLSNLAALEGTIDEEGIIELIELATEAMSEVTQVVERMAEATMSLGGKFTLLTEEVNATARSGSDMKAAKRFANRAADDLEVFVRRMSVEIVEFNKQNSRAMELFGSVAMIAEKDFNEAPEDIGVAQAGMKGYTAAISNSADSLFEFRNIIFTLPRMTSPFNRARKRAIAVMDDLLNQLRIATSQSKDVEVLLGRLSATTAKLDL
ncbi:MAG TPA: DUF4062 domain-containing protein [Planctomycetaceae bacterium]|nr:DUF4062 domain-containing protein [Planctomycetaceae bacterium]